MRKNIIKIFTILFGLGLVFSFNNSVFADNLTNCDNLPEEVRKNSSVCNEISKDHDPKDKIKIILKKIVPWTVVLAVLMITYAGFVYTTSAGNPEKIKLAKDIIKYTIIGLIVIMLAGVIVSFVIEKTVEIKS